MNTDREKARNLFCSCLVMTEINGDQARLQREMAIRCGVAFALTGVRPKNLIAKRYLRGKARCCAYPPTLSCIQNIRLSYQHLTYFNNLYEVTRQGYLAQFRALH